MERQLPDRMPIWGGIECTINRVGDRYFDQMDLSGHYQREDDIDLFAGLGIQTLRYPLLWERHCPLPGADIDWSFADSRLEKIGQNKITPIVGLVHHGSGPAYVSFYDGSFEKGLAQYATKVAVRYPWIGNYTPVNEPLTTARFCGLYGHWCPHKRNDYDFLTILLSECKATVLSMQAIRRINSDAKLVQTEDLAKTYSTPLLSYQADFENLRRWLSFDLLSGKLNSTHPLWDYLLYCGIDERQLYFFLEHPCPPDLLGLNYYITSERFLDEDLSSYPRHTHGSNGRHDYADVEAVRVNIEEVTGASVLIKEAWQRYGLPMAITEAHLNACPEQQSRWFLNLFQQAMILKQQGIDLRAVTAWALLGSFGWTNLLTEEKGLYEAGVFDISTGTPEPRVLAGIIRQLNAGTLLSVNNVCGWWEMPCRVLYEKQRPVLAAG